MPRGPKGEKRAQTDHRLDNKFRCEGTSSLNPINHCLSQHATISAVHRFRRSSDSLLPIPTALGTKIGNRKRAMVGSSVSEMTEHVLECPDSGRVTRRIGVISAS
jgi:hypothetical protein